MEFAEHVKNKFDMKQKTYNMDKRILIQRPTTSRSATGAENVAWSDYRTVWAQVDYPNTGNSEEISTDQEQITRRVRFLIRYTGDVREKWRISYEGDTLDILRIIPIGRHEYEEITAEVRK
jgi:SPP1 family predicted phage head-tail adaptor